MIADLIRAASVSLSEIAEGCGVHRQQVEWWRDGKRPVPPARLDALADALGLDRAELHRLAAQERGYRV